MTLRYKPDGRPHAVRRLQPRLPQRRLQPDRRRRGRTSPASATCSTRRPPTPTRWASRAQFVDRRLDHEPEPVLHARPRARTSSCSTPNTSTQNLGNLGEVDYKGLELELKARVTDRLRGVPRRRLHGQRDQGIRPRRDRRRQPGAAGFRSTRVNLGAAVSAAAGGIRRLRAAFVRAGLRASSARPGCIPTTSPSATRSTC